MVMHPIEENYKCLASLRNSHKIYKGNRKTQIKRARKRYGREKRRI